MRLFITTMLGAALLLPAPTIAAAHHGNVMEHQEFAKAKMKKKKAPKPKKEEYMRAVPSK